MTIHNYLSKFPSSLPKIGNISCKLLHLFYNLHYNICTKNVFYSDKGRNYDHL